MEELLPASTFKGAAVYISQWNGLSRYAATIVNNHVTVRTFANDLANELYLERAGSKRPKQQARWFTKLVGEYDCSEIWIGSDIPDMDQARNEMEQKKFATAQTKLKCYQSKDGIVRRCGVSAKRDQWDGSTILLRLEDSLAYVYVGGNRVTSFTTKEPITEYYSPIGNNAVPYPVAYSEHFVYFPGDNQIVHLKFVPQNMTVQQRVHDITQLLYGHLGKVGPKNRVRWHKNIETTKFSERVKTYTKRFPAIKKDPWKGFLEWVAKPLSHWKRIHVVP